MGSKNHGEERLILSCADNGQEINYCDCHQGNYDNLKRGGISI
ncbi:MAG: hypothetical protein ABSB22_16850 [Thermodesulfobacteriota bacterium]